MKMKEVNAKSIQLVEKKKGINHVEYNNTEEEASVLKTTRKMFHREQTTELLSSIELNNCSR